MANTDGGMLGMYDFFGVGSTTKGTPLEKQKSKIASLKMEAAMLAEFSKLGFVPNSSQLDAILLFKKDFEGKTTVLKLISKVVNK